MKKRQIILFATVVLAGATAFQGIAQAPAPIPGLPAGIPPPPAPPSMGIPGGRSPAGAANVGAGTTMSLPLRAAPVGGSSLRLKFNNAPLDIVLQDYSEHTHRTLLLAPTLPKVSVTLQSQGDLSLDEYLQAVETVLSMNGIALLKEGEKFLRVVPIDKARGEPMPIRSFEDTEKIKDSGELISQMIPLKNIEPAEAQKAVEPLKHAFGQIHVFEQINSIMVTDTSANVNRILEIIKYIDQAVEAREEPIIIEIRHAKATDIKSKLEEIIAEQQKGVKASTVPEQRMSGAPGVVTPPTPIMSSIIRARSPIGQPAETAAEVQAKAERGIISGTVKIVADERTNILIIITRKENMTFFEKVIKVLDVETTPEVLVKVQRLEYATAKDVEGMLNDLIGAVSSQKDDGGKSGSKLPSRSAEGAEQRESSTLRQYADRQTPTPAATPSSSVSTPGAQNSGLASKSKIGQLSKDNIKILSDERTNALILMASKGDMAMLEEIIKGMDIQISQVLIEAAVLDVQLDDTLKTGFDWVQRSMVAYQNSPNGTRSPLFSFAGGGGSGSGNAPLDATSLTQGSALSGGPGLTYYFTHFGLNMDAVMTMVQTDSRAKVLASPVILTHDNTEAVVDASQERYFYKGQRYVGGGVSGNYGQYEPDVERRKVGLHMKVKPHINEKRFVLMEISQQIEELGPDQQIGTDKWPTVLSREMSASIAVQSRETIILGGLVRRSEKESRSGIPFLYRIPLLGLLFRGSDKSKTADELIVFITPYVLNSPEEIMMESGRRKASLNAGTFWRQGWTESPLAEPSKKTKEELRMEQRIHDRLEAEGHLPPPSLPPAAGSVVTPATLQPAARSGTAAPPDVIEEMNSLENRWSESLKRVDEREAAAAKKP